MSEELSPLGLPRMYVFKIYYERILKRRHWSIKKLELWLAGHGLAVVGEDRDDNGWYLIVGTRSLALYSQIQNAIG